MGSDKQEAKLKKFLSDKHKVAKVLAANLALWLNGLPAFAEVPIKPMQVPILPESAHMSYSEFLQAVSAHQILEAKVDPSRTFATFRGVDRVLGRV